MSISRLRPLAAAALIAGLAIAFLVLSADQAREPGVFLTYPEREVAPGRLTLEFHESVPAAQRELLLQGLGVAATEQSLPPGFVEVQVPEERRAEVGEALAASDAVVSVGEQPLRYPQSIPNDPDWDKQWNLRMVNADVAYDISDGSGVVVAVVDTGLAFENYTDGTTAYGKAPDLQSPFVFPYDVWGVGPGPNDADEHPNDDRGHGTHVAEIIAEATNNGLAAAGIADGVTIMPVKICGPDPTPTQAYGCFPSDIAAGIVWAVDHGAQVINLSIGGGPGDATPEERAAIQFASDAGVVVVAAAGNQESGGDPLLDFPAALTSVISVGAVGIAGQLAYYSNHGTDEHGNLMDLVAPGGDPREDAWVWQQTYASCADHEQSFTTFAVSPCYGTSMAAPHVTGVAALIRSAFPGLNATQVGDVLRCSALDLGIPGPDTNYGYGLVQADAALANADEDNLPDCIDPAVTTPTPTPEPPPNDCVPPTASPATPSPTPTPTPTPTPEETEGGIESDDVTLPPTPSPTPVGQTPPPSLTVTPTPSPTPARIKCGDVNCNGDVDGLDSLNILAWMAQVGPDAPCLGKGYVNCDGALDAADATTILRFTGGLPLGIPASCPGIW